MRIKRFNLLSTMNKLSRLIQLMSDKTLLFLLALHSPERRPGNIREKERECWAMCRLGFPRLHDWRPSAQKSRQITKSRKEEITKSGKHSNNTRNREHSEKLRHRLPQQRPAELLELPLTLLIPFPYFLPCSPSSDSLFVAAVAVAVVSSLAIIPLVC